MKKQAFLTSLNRGFPPFFETTFRQKPIFATEPKRKPGHNLSASQKKRNRKHSSIRARVEHVFRVIKRQFGFTKTRYRGLMKNTVQVNMLMGLANLYLLRRRLMAA